MHCLLYLCIGVAPLVSHGSQHPTAGAKYPLAVSGILSTATLVPKAADTILVSDTLTITTFELAEKSRTQDPTIPVQGFFNADGKEVFRHVGFLAEAEVTRQLTAMGVAQ